MRDLVLYCDSSHDIEWESLKTISSKPQLLMLLENGTDILCTGETGADRVTELNKKLLYDAVKSQYIAKGQRWSALRNISFDGFIDWGRFFGVESRHGLPKCCPSLDLFYPGEGCQCGWVWMLSRSCTPEPVPG